MSNKSKREILDAAYADLCENHPVMQEKKPLAIGVHGEVLAIVLDPKIVSFILGKHTRSGKYLKALSLGGKRFHLDGTESGEVSELHQVDAVGKMADRNSEKERKKSVKKELKSVEKPKLKAAKEELNPVEKPKLIVEKEHGLALQVTKITVKKRRAFQVNCK